MLFHEWEHSAHCHEGDGPAFHLLIPAQGLQCPGQGPMSGYPGGIWSGAQYDPHTMEILVPAPDGGKGGGVLWARLPDPPRVTKEYPLSPTIFNVVLDSVIKHWVTVLGGFQGEIGQVLGESIQTLMAIFYDNDGLVTLSEGARLQGSFNVLTGLFDRASLRTNEGNTVSMDCRPCHTPHAGSTHE